MQAYKPPLWLTGQLLKETKMRARHSLITIAATILVLHATIARAQTDWPTFGFDRQRTGYNPEEAILSPQTVPSLTLLWSIDLGAGMSAQPVEMYGILYIATWGGIVYAIDPNSGNVIWANQLGTFSDDSGVFGVFHTLTTDQGNGRIFAISGDGLLHALTYDTGAEWPYSPGFPTQVFDPSAGETVWGSPLHSYENTSLYVPIASRADTGNYHGRVVQIDALWSDAPQVLYTWYVTGANGPVGGGVWGYGGVSLDPLTAIYAATGNALDVDPESYLYADKAVVRLDLNLNVQAADGPTVPAGEDLDFGSTPILFQPPGCPNETISLQKNGQLFLYNRDAIGNGPIQVLQISGNGGYTGYLGSVVYDPVFNQIYTSNNVDDGAGIFYHGLIAFSVQQDCTLALAWQQTVGVNDCCDENPTVPPVAANGVVYHVSAEAAVAYAFDAASGAYLWDSGSLIGSRIYASPTVVNGQLFVAGVDHKLYAFSPSSSLSSARGSPQNTNRAPARLAQ
jgi:outer membrane protein assembly factor BamB